MSDPQQTQTEGNEETFISHLVELRDRIIRAGIAVIVVFLGLVYWAPNIFRLLARPLMMNLPANGKMIVTDVTGSFFVPMKVTMRSKSTRLNSSHPSISRMPSSA